MIKTIKKKTTTKKAAEKVKTAIDDSEKVRPMTYDEACTRVMELQSENDELKNECEKLTAGCQDLSDANQRLNKTCNDILAEKANLKNDFDAIKEQNIKFSDTIKEQIHQMAEKDKLMNEKDKVFNACIDIAAVYQRQRKRFRLGFFIALLALVFENAWLFSSYFQTWIDLLK